MRTLDSNLADEDMKSLQEKHPILYAIACLPKYVSSLFKRDKRKNISKSYEGEWE